jgi:hypothetical protein
MKRPPNKAAAPNRRPALRFERAEFVGSWIRCQSPFPAAVGELVRSPKTPGRRSWASAARWVYEYRAD